MPREKEQRQRLEHEEADNQIIRLGQASQNQEVEDSLGKKNKGRK